MANTELPNLTAGAACSAADLFYTTQGGNSRKVTGAQLQSLCADRPPFVAGRWYASHRATYVAVPNVGAGVLQLSPFYLSRTITISDLGVRVVGSDAGNVQVAIYGSDANNLPTGNALASTGNITCASSAAVSADITGANVTLAPGLYWAADNFDNAAATVQGVSNAFVWGGYLAGSTTLSKVASGSASSGIALTIAQTYGTWPDLTAGSFTEVNNAAGGPILFMKAA